MEYTRRPRPFLVSFALALGLGACGGGEDRPGTPPDRLLLITVEGLRPDHLSARGYVRDTTCVEGVGLEYSLDLDHLFASGVTFANAFAPTGRLRPSLASLMTGLTPLEHRLLDEDAMLDPSLPTLAEGFSTAGFKTGATVFSRQDLTSSGLDRGFERFQQVPDEREVLKAAVNMLHKWAETDSPFFLWMHFGGLGPPFAGEGFRDQFSAPDDGSYGVDFSSPVGWASGEIENNAKNRARLNDLYDGEVRRLALLLDEFFVYYYDKFTFHFQPNYIDTNLFRDTLFVVVGTSGMELAERGAPCGYVGSEESLVDTGLRVPLVLRHPQSLTGRRILGEVVEVSDVAPTMHEWFSLEGHPGISDRSLLALTDSHVSREFPSRPALGLGLEGRRITGYTLRDEKWRAVFGPGGVELYQVEIDPWCREDRAAEYPERVEEWRARLETLRATSGASAR